MAGNAATQGNSPPPELETLIEGTDALPPGRALDLGCGSGIDTVYMALHGWEVTGIDYEERAIADAKARARVADVNPHLIQGDVTRLSELGTGDGFALLLDVGCFHTLPKKLRDTYMQEVTAVAAAEATLLMFAFGGIPGTAPRAEVEARFSQGWEIAWHALPHVRPMFAPSWYLMHRRG
jgi:SAM-dependent methyltransferase